jgi:signal transduction histidine kinase
VQDDGKGFDPELALAKTGHWGFRGMRERARVIGATFAVDTAPGRGTTIGVGFLWKK